MNSFSDYKEGSATAEYRAMVDKAAAVAEKQKSRVDPMYHEKIDHLLDTYARKLAENMNQGFAIDARVPSVLIAGPSNFPVGKKEKQNRARDSNMEEWRYIQGLLDTELGPEGVYRYYSTQRPVDIGTYPKLPDNQPLSIVNYDDDRRRPVADGSLMAWGELTYAKPLTEKQMEDYELKPAPGNPDRVRPSITARLKEGTRGQEPPKEPGQKRSHKNHEER